MSRSQVRASGQLRIELKQFDRWRQKGSKLALTPAQPFATLVTEMAADWYKSNTAYVRQFWLMPDADLDAVAKALRQSFAGTSVQPDLVDDFFNVTRQHVLKGDRIHALKTSQLAVELYPESPVANFLRGSAVTKSQVRLSTGHQ